MQQGNDAQGAAATTDTLSVVGLVAPAVDSTKLENFINAIPADSGMAYVVVADVPTERNSRIKEVKVKPNHLYIIPPDHNLSVVDGTIVVSPPDTQSDRNFLRTLSHEFRTPLNGILGYSDLLLLDKDLTAIQAERLNRIQGVVWHLSGMIDVILSLARLDAEQESAHRAVVDMCDVVREAAIVVEPAVINRGLVLGLDLPARPVRVLTDHVKARQILINLLGNAVKYTPQGQIRVTIEADDERIRVHIHDTGVGIAAEHFDRIFERFWQVSGGHTRAADGTGLGLAAAREFSHLLGGDVTVASELGTGSVFTLSLPLAP